MSQFKLKLGVSGYVYSNSGRKGERLFERLTKDAILSEQLDYFASGSGWHGNFTPCPMQWDDMQNYYKQLDIFLCTSTIEGIPIPVLEALSMGIPTVMPIGVGILDDIHNSENIYRYKVNDYDDMILAIKKCIDDITTGHLNRESLRSTTHAYTLDNWVNSHLSAFEDLLYNTHRTQIKATSIPMTIGTSDLDGKMGIYYVAYGEPARNCFKHALTSVRKHLGDIPVCLVADTPVDIDLDYLFIEYPDNDIGARGNKTLIYELAPKDWQYVLYLDVDTEIISHDVMLFFELLRDGFDVVFCINPISYILVSDMNRPDNKEEMNELIEMLGTGELLQLNGGVFAFRRNETTQKVFNDWHKEWNRYGKRDQAALDRVLYNNQVRIYTLGVEWNTVTRYLPPERSAGILHYPLTARRWQGRIEGRLDGSEAWASVHPDRSIGVHPERVDK
jgi:glycosyl transferase family 1/nucleotide-diphospho-sugar transferase